MSLSKPVFTERWLPDRASPFEPRVKAAVGGWGNTQPAHATSPAYRPPPPPAPAPAPGPAPAPAPAPPRQPPALSLSFPGATAAPLDLDNLSDDGVRRWLPSTSPDFQRSFNDVLSYSPSLTPARLLQGWDATQLLNAPAAPPAADPATQPQLSYAERMRRWQTLPPDARSAFLQLQSHEIAAPGYTPAPVGDFNDASLQRSSRATVDRSDPRLERWFFPPADTTNGDATTLRPVRDYAGLPELAYSLGVNTQDAAFQNWWADRQRRYGEERAMGQWEGGPSQLLQAYRVRELQRLNRDQHQINEGTRFDRGLGGYNPVELQRYLGFRQFNSAGNEVIPQNLVSMSRPRFGGDAGLNPLAHLGGLASTAISLGGMGPALVTDLVNHRMGDNPSNPEVPFNITAAMGRSSLGYLNNLFGTDVGHSVPSRPAGFAPGTVWGSRDNIGRDAGRHFWGGRIDPLDPHGVRAQPSFTGAWSQSLQNDVQDPASSYFRRVAGRVAAPIVENSETLAMLPFLGARGPVLGPMRASRLGQAAAGGAATAAARLPSWAHTGAAGVGRFGRASGLWPPRRTAALALTNAFGTPLAPVAEIPVGDVTVRDRVVDLRNTATSNAAAAAERRDPIATSLWGAIAGTADAPTSYAPLDTAIGAISPQLATPASRRIGEEFATLTSVQRRVANRLAADYERQGLPWDAAIRQAIIDARNREERGAQ